MDTFIVKETLPETHLTTANAVWKTWNPELVEELKSKNELAFIDFTAKWCLTCKVNKKLVLDTTDFYKLANDHKINLLIADWTKRDENITNFLNENNLAGVPAYFLLNKKGELKFLGETISIKKIEENL